MKIYLLLMTLAVLLPNVVEGNYYKWAKKLKLLCTKHHDGLVLIPDSSYITPFKSIRDSCPPMLGRRRKIYSEEQKKKREVKCVDKVLDLCDSVDAEVTAPSEMTQDVGARFSLLKSTNCPMFRSFHASKTQSQA